MNAAAEKALTSSAFELFGLQPAFALDSEVLESSYRQIQSRVHPDRFARSGDAERRASLQWTTRVNEAYQVLKNPVQRAKHLLDLQGVDVAFETNTQMPTDFLLRQLEFRESLEAAVSGKDAGALDALRLVLSGERKILEAKVGLLIDSRKDYAAAADEVRKLMFLVRLDEEVGAAYEAVE
jgi:molecular chaperone HscB